MNYVVTALDQRYWSPWGISWIASLRELAQTKANLIVLDCGLRSEVIFKLKEERIRVISIPVTHSIRDSGVNIMAQLAVEQGGNWAFFDADCWFQRSIDDLWSHLNEKLVISVGANVGFVAGKAHAWAQYLNAQQCLAFLNENDGLINYMRFFVHERQEISQTWNCTQVYRLKDVEGWLSLGNEPMNVIHPTGSFKSSAVNRNLLFQERYPDLFGQYQYRSHSNTFSPRKRLIVPKKSQNN